MRNSQSFQSFLSQLNTADLRIEIARNSAESPQG